MGTNGCRLCSGQRRIPQHFQAVARAVGVVGKARCGDIGPLSQYLEDSRVQLLSTRLRERVLKGSARKLMPEGKRGVLIAHHAHAQATLDAWFIRSRGLLEQPWLGLARDNADELRDIACCRRKPDGAREHR